MSSKQSSELFSVQFYTNSAVPNKIVEF